MTTLAPVLNLRNVRNEQSSGPFTHLFKCAKDSASAGVSGVRQTFAGVGCSDENWFCNASTVGKTSSGMSRWLPNNQPHISVSGQVLDKSTKTSEIFPSLTAFLQSTAERNSRKSLSFKDTLAEITFSRISASTLDT